MKKKTPVKKANKEAAAVSVAAAKSAPESGVAKVASAKKSDETEDDSTVVVDVPQVVEPGR